MNISHEVLDKIADAEKAIRGQEEPSIDQRKLTGDAVAALRESGVMRVIQPKRYGGYEADPRVFNEALFEISRFSSAAGWVAGVVGVHSWHLGLYPDLAQEEVWGADPDTWISSSYGPSGTYIEVDGGFELTGRWGFSSGSDHCEWAFVGAMSRDHGDGPPVYRHLLLPRADYQIHDVWDTSGLAGTGSNDIEVSGAFVPSHRAMKAEDLYNLDCPGREVNTGPLFDVPWYSMFLNAIVMPIVGMARSTLDECLDFHRERVVADPNKLPNPITLAELAAADAQIDAARLVLQSNLGDIVDSVDSGLEVTMAQRQRAKRDHISAVRWAVAAADSAYMSGGPRSIKLSNSMQRTWRDVHAGQHHAMNLRDTPHTEYGTYLLNGEPGTLF